MAFATEVKEELAHVAARNTCCRRAELSAIAKIDGTLHVVDGEYGFEIASGSAAVARVAVGSLHDLYQLKTRVIPRRSVLRGTANYLVEIEPQAALVQALNELGIIDDRSRVVYGILPRLVRRRCDQAAFLRGAFLAGGFVAHPGANAHLELTSTTDELAQDLGGLLVKMGLSARLSRRRNLFTVYLKGRSHVARFLAIVGAFRGVLALEDAAVLKEVKAEVNRLVNCDTANVAKAVAAAAAQIKAIRELEAAGLLSRLPCALREAAEARLEYPEATLTELGQLMVPRLSKSAVYHRLRRLEAIAGERPAARRRSSVPGRSAGRKASRPPRRAAGRSSGRSQGKGRFA